MPDLITFRGPAASDAADLWRLARDSGSLDLNSPYAYLMWCTDFADTAVVATDGDEVVGFVVGHRPPTDPDSAFVWQVAVAALMGLLFYLSKFRAWLGRGFRFLFRWSGKPADEQPGPDARKD